MKQRLAIVGAALVAALLLGGYSRVNGRPERATTAFVAVSLRAAPAALRREARHAAARAEAAVKEAPQARSRDGEAQDPPRSLAGTSVDGALRVGPDGKLVIGPDVRRFFDYFLSATGEESDAALRARIEAAIREQLPEGAALEAIALLDKYLGYREAARVRWSAEGATAPATDPAGRLEAVRALRREHFDEQTAELLFGGEELEGAVAVEQSRILKDSSLSAEEREAQLQKLEDSLPEAVKEARAEAVRPLQLRADEEALRATGATDEEIRRRRAEVVGDDAAGRLSALDQRRAEWKQRVEAFRVERERLAQRIPDESARAAAEQKLLEGSFEPEERLRVKAILSLSKP